MRIYKMTATFGKLEQKTLILEPGLNIIEAPNEWGKSTWCAFLLAMFYGLDTRAKSTKTVLADKEKYLPWSGSPMAGRIDLRWNGRDITIERSTTGRTPMGVFRAYETASGLAVPELTAASCGQVLLGVEQSVFRRTGFIRQSDMPVTQDEALRRRLNALVTTGDETGDSDRLAEEWKELKNKCRYNRSGLLPQAEARQKELEERLSEMEMLEQHCRKLKERLAEVKSWGRVLENHRDALLYAQAEADAEKVAQARDLRDRAERELSFLERRCAGQPSREEVDRKIKAIEAYRQELADYQAEEAGYSQRPQPPVIPRQFREMTPEQAECMVRQDCGRQEYLVRAKAPRIFMVLAAVLLVLFVPVVLMKAYLASALIAGFGIILLLLGIRRKSALDQEREALEEKYGTRFPEAWKLLLENYQAEKKAYDQAVLDYRVSRGDLDIKKTFLQKQRESLFGSQFPEAVLELWQKMQRNWTDFDSASREYQKAEAYLNTLQSMAKTGMKPPAMEDILSYPPGETEKLLREAVAEQQRLQNRLGQYQGRMEALGDAGSLQRELQALAQRIGKLEEVYAAAELALETLAQARQALQRKFAPRIASRAQALLGKMTGGRYDRLTLSEDLSLLAGTGQEETLRESLWRSDGTVDQLYLSLRLAVAGELIPKAPLVLDDAFVRFDDTRLKAALEILKEEAQQKQVILFTCQSREKEYCGK